MIPDEQKIFTAATNTSKFSRRGLTKRTVVGNQRTAKMSAILPWINEEKGLLPVGHVF